MLKKLLVTTAITTLMIGAAAAEGNPPASRSNEAPAATDTRAAACGVIHRNEQAACGDVHRNEQAVDRGEQAGRDHKLGEVHQLTTVRSIPGVEV